MPTTKQAKVANMYGVTCTVAGRIVRATIPFKNCKTKILHNGNEADSKSIFAIVVLELCKGYIVDVVSEGEDEEQACEAAVKVLEREQNNE